jgi:hypothetical protein
MTPPLTGNNICPHSCSVTTPASTNLCKYPLFPNLQIGLSATRNADPRRMLQILWGSNNDELTQCLFLTQKTAWQYNEAATAQTTQYANQDMKPHPFQPRQLVLQDEHFFLQKNQKLASKRSIPIKILQFIRLCNVQIELWHNKNRKIIQLQRA